MIVGFSNKETELIWKGFKSKKLPIDIQNVARRKLRIINNAVDLNDIRIPPANRLEKLKGNLSSYHSIRINQKWRIIFVWDGENARNVEILDYH